MCALYIIGIDGGTFSVIKPGMEAGLLPNLGKLLTKGCYAALQSTIPPMTAPAWTSFMTGVQPSLHGIFDFHQRIPYSYSPQYPVISYKDIKLPTIFDVAGQVGKSCLVFGVPITYPVPLIDGVWVSGLLTPHDANDYCYPTSIIELFEQRFGKLRLEANWECYVSDSPQRLFNELYEVLRQKIRFLEWVLEKRVFELSVIVFSEIDQAQHFLWHLYQRHGEHSKDTKDISSLRDDYIMRLYRIIDGLVGYILNRLAARDSIIVMSDHGFGAARGTLYLNQWLHELGYLSWADSANAIPGNARKETRDSIKILSFESDNPYFKNQPNLKQVTVNGITRLCFELRAGMRLSIPCPRSDRLEFYIGVDDRYWHLKHKAGARLRITLIGTDGGDTRHVFTGEMVPFREPGNRYWQKVSLKIPEKTSKTLIIQLECDLFPGCDDYFSHIAVSEEILGNKGSVSASINYLGTAAYAGSPSEMGIFINTSGIKPLGTVSPDEYHDLRDEIIHRLLKLSDPLDGNRVIQHVFKREELFPGKFIDNAPDLIVIPNDMGYHLDGAYSRQIIDHALLRSGSHRLEGIFLAYGSGIKSCGDIGELPIESIAFISSLLLGLPLPGHIDQNQTLEKIGLKHCKTRVNGTSLWLMTPQRPYLNETEHGDEDAISKQRKLLQALGYIEEFPTEE